MAFRPARIFDVGRDAPQSRSLQRHEPRCQPVYLLRCRQRRRADLSAGEDRLRVDRRDAGRRGRFPAALPHHQRCEDGQREPDAETFAADPYRRLPDGRGRCRDAAALYRQRRGQGALFPRPQGHRDYQRRDTHAGQIAGASDRERLGDYLRKFRLFDLHRGAPGQRVR